MYHTRMPADDYVTMRVRASVVSEARRLVRQLAARADRELTQSDALTAAIALALADLDGAAARLPAAANDDQALSD